MDQAWQPEAPGLPTHVHRPRSTLRPGYRPGPLAGQAPQAGPRHGTPATYRCWTVRIQPPGCHGGLAGVALTGVSVAALGRGNHQPPRWPQPGPLSPVAGDHGAGLRCRTPGPAGWRWRRDAIDPREGGGDGGEQAQRKLNCAPEGGGGWSWSQDSAVMVSHRYNGPFITTATLAEGPDPVRPRCGSVNCSPAHGGCCHEAPPRTSRQAPQTHWL